MSAPGWLCVAAGGALGACARWGLGVWLNPLLQTLPLGTLVANLVGGYLMGLVIGAVSLGDALSPEARLFLATGVLGALTTFSTFSAEVTTMLLRGQLAWAAGTLLLHVAGAIAMTMAGYLTVQTTLAMLRA